MNRWQIYYKKNREKILKRNSEYRNKNKLKERDRHSKYYEENKEKIKEYYQKNKSILNEKRKKYGKKLQVVRAKARHNIPLNSYCDICHSTENLQRHHWRYDKPLLVNTLCKECHDIQHIRNFNESRFGGLS